MNNTHLIELIDKIDRSSLAYFEHHEGDYSLILAKEVPQGNAGSSAETPAPAATESPQKSISMPTTAEAPATSSNNQEAPGEEVTSPMVGVAYMQPSPEVETYVKVGDKVEAGDVLCLIEAMKLMNEIQAPTQGVITEILVENEEVVEYGQPLFRIQ